MNLLSRLFGMAMNDAGKRHVAPKTLIGVLQHRWRDHMIAGYVADIAVLEAAEDPRAAWA